MYLFGILQLLMIFSHYNLQLSVGISLSYTLLTERSKELTVAS